MIQMDPFIAKLGARGIHIPDAPTPIADYVPAVREGNLVWTSGQLPLVAGKLTAQGCVGFGPDDVTPEVAVTLARQATLNALAAVHYVSPLATVVQVLRVTGYVASARGFFDQPAVVNGASALLTEVFGEGRGRHSRCAVGVAALPLNSPVEVDIVVVVRQ